MKRSNRTLLVLATFLAAGAASACEGKATCTAEAVGLADARTLALRRLPGRPTTAGACAQTQLRVVTTDEELRSFYADAGITEAHPAVDFVSERVIVREGTADSNISFAAARGEAAYVGLLSCSVSGGPSCAVQVVAVPAVVTSVESRACEPVGCGAVPLR